MCAGLSLYRCGPLSIDRRGAPPACEGACPRRSHDLPRRFGHRWAVEAGTLRINAMTVACPMGVHGRICPVLLTGSHGSVQGRSFRGLFRARLALGSLPGQGEAGPGEASVRSGLGGGWDGVGQSLGTHGIGRARPGRGRSLLGLLSSRRQEHQHLRFDRAQRALTGRGWDGMGRNLGSHGTRRSRRRLGVESRHFPSSTP